MPFLTFGQFHLDSAFSSDGLKEFMPNKSNVPYFLEDGSIRYFEYDSATTAIIIKSLRSDGSEEVSFGSGGKIVIPTRGYKPREVLTALNGDLIIKVYKPEDAGVLLKLSHDYSVDSSFGENGIARVKRLVDSSGTLVWRDGSGLSHAVTQPDGKILFGGVDEEDSIHLFRFTADGFIDTTFGYKGHILKYNGLYTGSISNIAVMEDGRVVIGGVGYNESVTRSLMLMRFHSDGSLDTSFNHTGKLYTRLGMDGLLYGIDMCLQSDKIIIAGSIGSSFLARFGVNGNIDTTFNHIGYTILPDSVIPTKVKLNSEGFMIGANIGYIGARRYFDFGLIKMTHNGIIDSSFYSNGIFRDRFPNSENNEVANVFLTKRYIYLIGLSELKRDSPFDEPEIYPLLYRFVDRYDSDKNCGTLYPNPASEYLQIDIKSECRYNIYDNVGRVVLSGILLPGQQLEVSNLASALYYLRLSNNTNNCTYKFIKK